MESVLLPLTHPLFYSRVASQCLSQLGGNEAVGAVPSRSTAGMGRPPAILRGTMHPSEMETSISGFVCGPPSRHVRFCVCSERFFLSIAVDEMFPKPLSRGYGAPLTFGLGRGGFSGDAGTLPR